MPKARIKELDALRGLAAMAVVLFHYVYKYNMEYGNGETPHVFEFGQYGVHLFFMISGYVIFMTVDNLKSWTKFAGLRFSRLFPVYWSAIILTYIVVSLFGLTGREISWKAFLFNFSMLQELFVVPHADGAYWSLLPELMFYVLMGFLIRFNAINHIRTVNMIWLGLILTSQYLTYPETVIKLLNLKYGALFVAGIEFYLLKKEKNSTGTALIYLSWALAYFTVDDLVPFLVISAFYLLFIGLHFNKLSILNSKLLVFLGAISYPLYLIHQNIGYVLMNLVELNIWIEVSLAILLSLGLSTLVHFFIEKPTLKYLRAKFNKR